MKKKNVTLIFLFIILIPFSGCNDKKNQKKKTSKIISVLFDLSETTNTKQIREKYLEDFKTILKSITFGDAIEAALITERSLSEMNLSVNYEFEKFNPGTDNSLIINSKRKVAASLLQTKKDSIIKVVDSLLFKPKRKIMWTEIIASLGVVERIFKTLPQQRKILIIFSDMIEESSFANFQQNQINEKWIDKFILKQKKANLLPDLKNVKVYVVGAQASSTKKYNGIKNFWIKYFNETGANLLPQNYGAALIRFNE